MSDLARLLAVLRCPDDGGSLSCEPTVITCLTCGRTYDRPRPELVDLTTARPHAPFAGMAPAFYDAYLSMREAPLRLSDAAQAWGAPETMEPEWVRLRRLYSQRVVELVFQRLGDRQAVALDTSAGAGYVSFALAERGLPTIHADLDPQSVGYALRFLNDGRQGLPLLIVRADYLALPVRGTADVVIATDSLIRGVGHELAALRAIRLALRDDGFAIVDFHNWLHNPLRRLGVLADNFAGNRSYFRHQVRRLLRKADLATDAELTYRQEDDQPIVRRLLAPLVPPTRFVLVVRKARAARP